MSTNDPRTTIPIPAMDSATAEIHTGTQPEGAAEDARSTTTALPATNVEFASRH